MGVCWFKTGHWGKLVVCADMFYSCISAVVLEKDSDESITFAV